MREFLKRVCEFGVIPAVKIEDPEQAIPTFLVLNNGWLPVMEVLFRSAAAEEAIKVLTTEFPDALIGAGTIKLPDELDRAMKAGAKFIVMPGMDPDMIQYCLEQDMAVVPGVSDPDGMMQAVQLGLEVVKFFPVGRLGGPSFLKYVSGPFPELQFVPTGGVSPDNMKDYMALPNVCAVGGTWIAPEKLIVAAQFEEIATLARQAVLLALDFSVNFHLGINRPDAETALVNATLVSQIFGLPVKNGNSSVFVGTVLEFLKTPGRGQHGHIAIGTSSIPRALAYLKRNGIQALPDTANPATGKPKAIYLDMEIAGFAVHLLQK